MATILWKAQRCHKIWLHRSETNICLAKMLLRLLINSWSSGLLHCFTSVLLSGVGKPFLWRSVSKYFKLSGSHTVWVTHSSWIFLSFFLLSFPHTPFRTVEVILSLRAVCWQIWPDSRSFLTPGSYSLISVKMSTRILRSRPLIGNKDWLCGYKS